MTVPSASSPTEDDMDLSAEQLKRMRVLISRARTITEQLQDVHDPVEDNALRDYLNLAKNALAGADKRLQNRLLALGQLRLYHRGCGGRVDELEPDGGATYAFYGHACLTCQRPVQREDCYTADDENETTGQYQHA